jgi:HlyD family secretion protein
METKNKRKKWIWITVGLVAVLGLGLVGWRALRGNATAVTQTATGEIVAAFVGELAANATASGQLAAQREAGLTRGVSGTVAEIYVAVGDTAAAGDPLLRLDTAELERAVVSTEQALAIQQANLATLLAPASDLDIAAAQASLVSAQVSLADLLAGPSADELASKEANVRAANADIAAASSRLNDLQAAASAEELRAAQIELELAQADATSAAEQHSTILVTDADDNPFLSEEDLADMEFSARVTAVQANANLAAAQEAYDNLAQGDANAIASAQASLALAVAQRDAAQAQLNLLMMPASAAQIASAEASVAQAEATLDRLRRGPSDLQIAQMETAVAQAEISLQRAQNNLEKATLTAPFAGVVTAVHVNVGEQANGVLVEMVDSASLELILAVDEVDIGNIAVGQTAVVALETWPDDEIAAAVRAIAPEANNGSSALVTYDVFLELGTTGLPLLAGMTGNASLVTADIAEALLLPNAAINADREAGTYSVNLVVDEDGAQTVVETAVSIGLRDGRYTQIVDGLSEGDRVLIGDVLPVQRLGPGSGNEDNRPPLGGG